MASSDIKIASRGIDLCHTSCSHDQFCNVNYENQMSIPDYHLRSQVLKYEQKLCIVLQDFIDCDLIEQKRAK